MSNQPLPLLYDIEAEKRLLSAVAVAPELLEHAGELAATDFYQHDHRWAWEKLGTLIRAGQAVVASDYAEFFQAGEVVPLPEYVAEDARRVRAMCYRREAAATGQSILRSAYYKPDDLEKSLKAAGGIEPGVSADTLMPAKDVVSEAWDELANHAQIMARMMPTGLKDLDEALGGGLEPETLTVLMARPSMGKTAAMVQIADFASARGLVVAVFSKEMSRRQWLRRTAFRQARASWLAFKQGRLDPTLESAVYARLAKLSERDTLWVDDSTPQSSADVLALCRALKRRAGRLDLVLVDHLRLFSDDADNETHRLGAISWNFKQLAKNLDTAVLAAAQINRGVESQSERRPDLKDLRDSGEIEENTDTVIGLYRDSYYSENVADKSAEFIVRKARDGERNVRVNFVFIPEYMSFEPLLREGSDVRKSGKSQGASAPAAQGSLAHV